MIKHLIGIGVIVLVMALLIVYPYLPLRYDSLAVPFSTMAQAIGIAGVPLVFIGALWLIDRARKRDQPAVRREYWFALAALLTGFVVMAAVFAVGGMSGSSAIGMFFFFASIAGAFNRLLPRVEAMKTAERATFTPVPIYLIAVPLVSLLLQLALAAPMTAFSRNQAIANSAEMIGDIEAYYAAQGRYPASLQGVWRDYSPDVVGIEKYHYAPDGDAYNLFFEQPRFVLDHIGTREFVVYNPLDEHFIISHTAWILERTPEQLESAQGWYEDHDAGVDHWRYFWFD